ncbi:hypothetical protein SeMB42_g02172 [Synchytrium endobioticum]|uniref:Uncharacterized protein n=1 Tax=Synchytrium endobioticum TaxID=286115 RepID=A0A507D765_9FUNG|nr:hypothetical protein SeLEV6574_g02830 [Synchytrium endobioticum]TPX50651.1 hypothetical protein SeMB42_g02172 [Synchytrium endobioticum]
MLGRLFYSWKHKHESGSSSTASSLSAADIVHHGNYVLDPIELDQDTSSLLWEISSILEEKGINMSNNGNRHCQNGSTSPLPVLFANPPPRTISLQTAPPLDKEHVLKQLNLICTSPGASSSSVSEAQQRVTSPVMSPTESPHISPTLSPKSIISPSSTGDSVNSRNRTNRNRKPPPIRIDTNSATLFRPPRNPDRLRPRYGPRSPQGFESNLLKSSNSNKNTAKSPPYHTATMLPSVPLSAVTRIQVVPPPLLAVPPNINQHKNLPRRTTSRQTEDRVFMMLSSPDIKPQENHKQQHPHHHHHRDTAIWVDSK